MRVYYVYLLTNKRNGTLYVGNTNDLIKRVWQHKNGLVEGFTKRYGIKMLVWFQSTENVYAAITREKQIKKWKRAWKVELIEKENPKWQDLYDELVTESKTSDFHPRSSAPIPAKPGLQKEF